MSLSSVFRISGIVPLLQQQWQEQKEGQHMLPDPGASAAAFCLVDICGVVGSFANCVSLLQGARKQTGVC